VLKSKNDTMDLKVTKWQHDFDALALKRMQFKRECVGKTFQGHLWQ